MNRARHKAKLTDLPEKLRGDVLDWFFFEKNVLVDPRSVIISGLEVYTYQPREETLRGCLKRLADYIADHRGGEKYKDTVNRTELAKILGVSRHTVYGFVRARAIVPQSKAERILDNPEGAEYAAYFRRWEKAKGMGAFWLMGCDNFRDWVKAHETLRARNYYNLNRVHNDLTKYIAEIAATVDCSV